MGLITRAGRWGVMERVLVFNFFDNLKCVEKERDSIGREQEVER